MTFNVKGFNSLTALIFGATSFLEVNKLRDPSMPIRVYKYNIHSK